MKILFDTNVLVSAFIAFKKSNTCSDIIDHAVEHHELYYSDFIINEFKKVFREYFRYPSMVTDEFSAFITKFFILGSTSETIEDVSRDPKDNQVLADALVNDIEIIITGDKDLLILKSYKGIKIIPPKEYWAI